MTQKIKNLKDSELTKVLADGFAELFHNKPQFPVTFLANYLKSYNNKKNQQLNVVKKLQSNANIIKQIHSKQEQLKEKQEQKQIQRKKKQQSQNNFRKVIEDTDAHQELLINYCQWIQKRVGLTGVYIGELQQPNKKFDIEIQDSQEAHIDSQNPKIIKFKAASNSHKFMCNKLLKLQSIVGKLATTQKVEGQAPPEQGGQEGGQPKPKQAQGQVYFPSVVGNNELYFFKYPRLGAYYSVLMKIKTYLSEKAFDNNISKVQNHKKAIQLYSVAAEQRSNKFKELYDQKQNGGAQQKELQQMQRQFEKQEANFVKPQLQSFQFIYRDFVVCFDTLGQDKQISQKDRKYLRQYVQKLQHEWQKKQFQLLSSDIDTQLKLLEGQQATLQQQFTKLLQEEQRQILGNQQVQKVKDNEKLMELQMDTVRIQKVKDYMTDQKYIPFFDALLSFNVLKYPEIMKNFMFFLDYNKKHICVKDTNVLDWRNCKKNLIKQKILETITNYNPRGGKIKNVLPYAKWQRIAKNLEKYDANNVVAYNIYLAFILRFLQITAKVRLADRLVRVQNMKLQRRSRQQRIIQRQKMQDQKAQKLANAKAEAQQKEQPFEEAAWILTYDQQNPLIQIGQQIPNEVDNDLQELILQEQPPVENPPE